MPPHQQDPRPHAQLIGGRRPFTEPGTRGCRTGLPFCANWRQHDYKSGRESSRPKNGEKKAKTIRESLQDKKKGLGRAYAKLRNGRAKPIRFLDLPDGNITAHQAKVDSIVQDDVTAHFLSKYSDYLFHGEQGQLKPITGARLLEELRSSAATAASWDQCKHGEWAVVPIEAADWLAKLLQLIEGGANSPQPTAWGKAFFLATAEEPSTDPMDHRILQIRSRLRRRWASMRLHDLHSWIGTWPGPREKALNLPGGTSAPPETLSTPIRTSLEQPSTFTNALTR